MADSKAQRIIDEVVARMQLIDGTGDYQTSIGERVEDSRQNWDENEMDAVSVFEGRTDSQEANDNRSKTIHIMPVVIKVFAKQRDTSAETAAFVRKAISDVKRAIRLDDRWKVDGVGLAMLTREKASGPEYADASSFEIVGCQIDIEVILITDKFNAES